MYVDRSFVDEEGGYDISRDSIILGMLPFIESRTRGWIKKGLFVRLSDGIRWDCKYGLGKSRLVGPLSSYTVERSRGLVRLSDVYHVGYHSSC